MRIGRFFGTSGEFWLNLQELYELRCMERENCALIALLSTLPITSKGTDETMASDEGGAASANAAMSNADQRTIEAEEVLVLDSSTFIREIGLMSTERLRAEALSVLPRNAARRAASGRGGVRTALGQSGERED